MKYRLGILLILMSVNAWANGHSKKSPVKHFQEAEGSGCLEKGEALIPTNGLAPKGNPCCRGLRPVIFKQKCDKADGAGFIGVCAPCGNGKCDGAYENACNCPKDCKK